MGILLYDEQKFRIEKPEDSIVFLTRIKKDGGKFIIPNKLFEESERLCSEYFKGYRFYENDKRCDIKQTYMDFIKFYGRYTSDTVDYSTNHPKGNNALGNAKSVRLRLNDSYTTLLYALLGLQSRFKSDHLASARLLRGFNNRDKKKVIMAVRNCFLVALFSDSKKHFNKGGIFGVGSEQYKTLKNLYKITGSSVNTVLNAISEAHPNLGVFFFNGSYKEFLIRQNELYHKVLLECSKHNIKVYPYNEVLITSKIMAKRVKSIFDSVSLGYFNIELKSKLKPEINIDCDKSVYYFL